MADFKKIIPFIRKWEGGLSRNSHDSAAKDPVPYAYEKTGLLGYHTNKGLTWTAFKQAGYQLKDYKLFYEMPDEVWERIFKENYWNKFYLDRYKSQVIANVVVTWSWGSGVGGAEHQLANFLRKNYAIKDNDITRKEMLIYFNKYSKKDEMLLFKQLIEARAAFFKKINQPEFLKGWLNRLKSFEIFNKGFFGLAGKITIVGVVLVFFSIFLYLKFK